MSTYTIGDVADRSGFSASALRYYEGIGLLAPVGRSGAGYRLYDEETLTRLAFIARAKQLGCSLDEITELVGIWDGQRCNPVQRRLHDLVIDKVARAHRQVAELTQLAAELERAAELLGDEASEGPCDDGCACLAVPATATPMPTPIVLARRDDVPIACALDSASRPARQAEWDAVLAGGRRTRTAAGPLRIELRPDVEVAELARLVAAEQRCCPFFSFALTVDRRGTALEVAAPDGAASIVTDLFGAAA